MKMNVIVLRRRLGLNEDGWGIEIGREHTISYLFGIFKRKTIKWTLWKKYTSCIKMLESLEDLKHSTSKYQFRPVQIKYQ